MHSTQEAVPAFPDFHRYRAERALTVLESARSPEPLTEALTLTLREKQAIRDAVRVLRG